MGASSSSSIPPPLPTFKHGIILEGLPQSGKSSIQSALRLPSSRVLSVDQRFLTTPRIFSTTDAYSSQPKSYWNSYYPEEYGSYNPLIHTKNWRESIDKSLWYYGGRIGIKAKWTIVAENTRAIVFTVNAMDRARLQPPQGHKPLPQEFVNGFVHRSEKEQAEILATLQSSPHYYAHDILHNLLSQFQSRWDPYDKPLLVPLLVVVTHADCEGAMTVEEVCDALKLHELTGKRDWRISSCHAVTGEGLHEAIDWLNMTISSPTPQPSHYVSRGAEELSPYGELIEKQEAAERETGTSDREFEYYLSSVRRREKERKFELGMVPKAPVLYKTNGEVLTLTSEQRETFVCSPVTLVDEDELKEDEYVNDPTVNEELAKMLMERVHLEDEMEEEGEEMEMEEELEKERQKMEQEQEDRERSDSTSSIASESSSSSSPQSPASPSSSSSPSDSESVSHLAVTRTHTPEPKLSLSAKQLVTTEQLDVKTFDKSHPRFTSLQSTTTPLLASHLIPTVERTLRKKHFFSLKKTLQPIENQSKSIHEGLAKRWRGW